MPLWSIFRSCSRPLLAHHDSPPFSGRPSLTGHCGHGWTCSLPRPVAIDIQQLQDGAGKKGLHRPRLSAIIPNLTAAGSHPDCRAVLIQIVALYGAFPWQVSVEQVSALGSSPGHIRNALYFSKLSHWFHWRAQQEFELVTSAFGRQTF